MTLRRYIFLAFLMLNQSCIHGWVGEPSKVYDIHPIKIQILSLFNQRANPGNSAPPWKGDWRFRRERLALIDRELSNIKPDLIVFQEMMKRESNPYESDRGILSAGILKGYKWKTSEILQYSDTGEKEFLALAMSSPFEVSEQDQTQSLPFGSSILVIDSVRLEKQNTLLANLMLENSVSTAEIQNIANEIKKRMSLEKICANRLLLVAHAPSRIEEKLGMIASLLDLKDASKGFCNTESNCYTESTRNEIFHLAYGETLSSRVDFLLVPRSAIVSLGKPNFTEPRPSDSDYFKQFGLTALWASDRFGWTSELVLAKCN